MKKAKPDKQEENRNADGTFRKGFSGNLKGRPKGKSLKEYARDYFASMTEEEKMAFMDGMSKETLWKMAEGNPDTKNILGGGNDGTAPILVEFINAEKNNS